jgi:hypothetical protein
MLSPFAPSPTNDPVSLITLDNLIRISSSSVQNAHSGFNIRGPQKAAGLKGGLWPLRYNSADRAASAAALAERMQSEMPTPE